MTKFITEAKRIISDIRENEEHKALHDHVRNHYQQIAHDLPRDGRGHYDAAHDYATDNLHDHFHKSHPKVNFRKIATHALKDYVSDDEAA